MSDTTHTLAPQMTLAPQLTERLKRYQSIAAFVGLIGLALSAFGYFSGEQQQFLRSYLIGFMLWTGAGLGCLTLTMIQHLTGGNWGIMIRKITEAGSKTLYVMMFLFIPILLGVHTLYEWADPAKVAVDPILKEKSLYLNVPFFYARWAIYTVLWLGLVTFLTRWSQKEDETKDPKWTAKMEFLSGPGILAFVLTLTLASVDWMMSLDPHWFSTIYGFMMGVGNLLTAMACVISALVVLGHYSPLDHLITKKHLHDLGKLMFAFVMLWAYLNFSQLLIIWSGNLPEEIPWYINRLNGGWQWVGLFLLCFHFAFPFFLLLSQGIKKNGTTLRMAAIWIIFVRFVDVVFLVEPSFTKGVFAIHWLDIAAPVGLGGVWVSLFLWNLPKRPILPIGHPDLQKALNHGRDH